MRSRPMGRAAKAALTLAGLAVAAAIAAMVLAPRDRGPMIPTATPPTAQELAAKREAAQRERPHTMLRLESVRAQRSREGASLMLSGAVVNGAGFDVADARIRCLLSGPTYTQIGQLTATLKGIVPAGRTRRFSGLDMGDMGKAPVAGVNCAVSGATSKP